MKKCLFLSALLLTAISIFAQDKVNAKIYAYKQPVLGGAAKTEVIGEQGTEGTTPGKQRFNYFIYLESTIAIHPAELWLNGSPYSAVWSTVKTPVYGNSSSADSSNVLVPKTSKRVIALRFAPAIESKLTSRGRLLSSGNELVVVYRSGGKYFYETVPVIDKIEAATMQ